MHKHLDFTYLRLQNPSEDVLFSGAQDYRATLDVIAKLSSSHTPIGAFCLLEQEVHLMALADEPQSHALASALMEALTGNRHHPLGRHWQFTAVSAKQLPQHVAKIHLLPRTRAVCSNADIHRWSSHQAFAHPASTPKWLATEAIWQAITPRQSNRVRAYLHQLERSGDQTLGIQQRTAQPSLGEAITEKSVAEFVLRDHQAQWSHLTHRRANRRKLHLAGLSCALCQYLNIYGESDTALSELFNLATEELDALARTACREASQYITTTASKIKQPHTAHYQITKPNQNKPTFAEPNSGVANAFSGVPIDDGTNVLDDDTALGAGDIDLEMDLDFSTDTDSVPNVSAIRLVAGR